MSQLDGVLAENGQLNAALAELASNGLEAVEPVDCQVYDVVLTGVRMPDPTRGGVKWIPR